MLLIWLVWLWLNTPSSFGCQPAVAAAESQIVLTVSCPPREEKWEISFYPKLHFLDALHISITTIWPWQIYSHKNTFTSLTLITLVSKTLNTGWSNGSNMSFVMRVHREANPRPFYCCCWDILFANLLVLLVLSRYPLYPYVLVS